MTKIKNECEIQTYTNDIELSNVKLVVKSHWNRRQMVEIIISGKRIYVNGDDLKMAIDNCMNVGI